MCFYFGLCWTLRKEIDRISSSTSCYTSCYCSYLEVNCYYFFPSQRWAILFESTIMSFNALSVVLHKKRATWEFFASHWSHLYTCLAQAFILIEFLMHYFSHFWVCPHLFPTYLSFDSELMFHIIFYNCMGCVISRISSYSTRSLSDKEVLPIYNIFLHQPCLIWHREMFLPYDYGFCLRMRHKLMVID